LTIIKIYDEYESIIVGITEDIPEDGFNISAKNRKRIFDLAFKYMPKVKVCIIKGTIVKSKDLNNLPYFDICLSGNKKVLKKIRYFGKKAKYVPRTKGVGFSGSDIRRCIKK